MGVFIFAETFGLFVKHSSGNSLLKFLPRHKHRGAIYSDRSVSFFQSTQTKHGIFFSEKLEMAIASFSFSETFQICCEIHFPSKISSPTKK